MKKILSTILLIALFQLLSDAQPITRVEDSPYPTATETPEKLYLTSENFDYSRKIVLQSLQGMLARTKPEILRDTHGHPAILENLVTIDRSYYNNFDGLLARYADRFDGYILCEARAASVNAAFSLCPVLNAIAVPADIEQAAINAGYTRLLDVRGKDEAWVLENYGERFSKSIASYQAVNDDRALNLADYSVFSGALQFWDASATGTLANSVYDRMNPCAVYFGWGAGEYNTVEQLSQHSAMIHPSDWSPNLSTLSNIPVKMPRQKVPQADYKVVPDVHTVCFVITDGDNIQWLSGSLNNTNNWANPDKVRLKLGWTISPAFVELAPAMYRKYIENALTTDGARNYLVAGPSGAGYYFPSIYPQLAAQNRFMNRILKKADLNIVNIIDSDGNHNPDEYLKQSNVDALFYYSYGGQYTKLAGQIKWYKDKPSIGGRFTLWGNSDDGSPETRNRVCQSLANTLNAQSTNIHSAGGYSLIPVHIRTMNPSDVLNVINKLNPNIRVVSPDEFVWLVRKNVRRLDVANGNGLRAEYTVADNSDSPLLTTNEPSVDFDDEYLTPATEAIGDRPFTAVWTGKLQALYSQKYTFHTTAEGGAVLKIDGVTLCDSIDRPSVTSSDTITLEAGKKYSLEFHYKKNGTKALATLEWESDAQVRQRIPRYQLFSRPLPDGVYKIYSRFSEKMIEASSASTSALIRQTSLPNPDNALWQIEPVPPLPNGDGNGLTADYYNGKEFNDWCLTQIDTTIHFNWGTARPHRNVSSDNYSVRWQGKIEPRTDGQYVFYVNSDNGRRLWINDHLIIDRWIDDYDVEYSGTISLQARKRYNLKLEYFESTGGAYCRLEWLSPRQPREIVPRSQLYTVDYNGLLPLTSNGELLIYPNPAQGDFVTVSLGDISFHSEPLVRICDLAGRVVHSQLLKTDGMQINISGILKGVYFVSLVNENNTIVKKLIIR